MMEQWNASLIIRPWLFDEKKSASCCKDCLKTWKKRFQKTIKFNFSSIGKILLLIGNSQTEVHRLGTWDSKFFYQICQKEQLQHDLPKKKTTPTRHTKRGILVTDQSIKAGMIFTQIQQIPMFKDTGKDEQ